MEYLIYCKTSGYEFCEKVDFLDDDCIDEVINEQFDDVINESIASYDPKPCGYFPALMKIAAELYAASKEYINKSIGGLHVFGQIVDGLGEVIKEIKIELTELLETKIDDRAESEQSHIDVGTVVLQQLERFVKQGVWHFGLQDQCGFINSDLSMWPRPIVNDDNIVWQNDCGEYKPIIWFGLESEAPLDCWTLSKDQKMFDVLDYVEPYNVERWKSFWFNKFWAFNWNILFDGKGDSCIIWMFAECGMDEPSIDEVIASCPILLNEDDTADILVKKIDDFFIMQYKVLS